MAWDVVDFAVFGAMLAGVGVAYVFGRRRSDDRTYRIACAVALAAAFLLNWVNAAVGIIGNETDAANLVFLGMIGTGIIGSLVTHGRPGGMAIVLIAMAFCQAAIAAIAIVARLGSAAPLWPKDVLMLSGFFGALWLLSAALFRKAAQQQKTGISDSAR